MRRFAQPVQPSDPRVTAPVGAYLTPVPTVPGSQLFEVLECSWDGVMCENVVTEYLLEIGRVDLAQHWRRIRPLQSV